MSDDTPSTGRGLGLALGLWLVAAALALVPIAGEPAIENRLSTWVAELDATDGTRALARGFGGDEVVILRVDGIQSATDDARNWVLGLEPRLRAQALVREVFHPLTAPLAGSEAVTFDLAAVARRPLVAELGVVRAPQSLDLILQTHADPPREQRAAFARAIAELRTEAADRGLRLRGTGHPLLAAALDAEAQRARRLYAPALVLGATLLLALGLRSLRLALLASTPACLALFGARLVPWLTGEATDFVRVGAGHLAFGFTLAGVLLALGGGRATGRAAWSALAIGIGALSFGTSDLRSLAALGGTLALVVLAIVPAFARLARSTAPGSFAWGERLAESLARFGGGHRRSRRLAAVFVLAAGVLAALDWPRPTRPLHYLPRGEGVRADFASIEAEGGALQLTEVLLERTDGSKWGLEEAIYEELGATLKGVDGVRCVGGPELVIADLEERLGALAFEPVQRLALVRSSRWDANARVARWTLRSCTAEAPGTDPVLAAVRRAVAEALGTAPDAMTARVTGSVPTLFAHQARLADALWRGLLFTAGALALLLLIATGSLRRTARSLVLALVPVAAVLVAARLLGLPLDLGTLHAPAVVLALGVALGGTPPARGLLPALGLALLLFGLQLSGLLPVAHFGTLAGIGVALAWVVRALGGAGTRAGALRALRAL